MMPLEPVSVSLVVGVRYLAEENREDDHAKAPNVKAGVVLGELLEEDFRSDESVVKTFVGERFAFFKLGTCVTFNDVFRFRYQTQINIRSQNSVSKIIDFSNSPEMS